MPIRTRRFPPFALAALLLSPGMTPLAAQGGGGPATPATPMINRSTDPLLKSFRFRNIGPASMGGRLHDIEVSESNPSVIYLGYAVGGIWKSENNGTSFTPVFDTYEVASFGDLAIHPTNPNIVYAGTGESNNRQTSSFGGGMYKTIDGGKTWQLQGLRETQSIARVVIDPKNPETVYAAVVGPLFGPSEERGIYKTTNGGGTWTKIKYIDENTGFTDIAIDRSNPNVLYAASYQRRRTHCCFNGGGPGSGIWKTTNGGSTWTRMSGNGLPGGTYGRIALDVSRSNPERRVRADRGRHDRTRRGRRTRAGGAGAGAGGGGGGALTGATMPGPVVASRWWRPRRRRRWWSAAVEAARPRSRKHPRRSIRLRAASSGRTTAAAPGRSSATATRGPCTSASCASIRRIRTRYTSPACRSRSRWTVATRLPR